jgi:anti-sigma factor RsiW
VDCEVIQPELVAYHFGAIDDEARASVERHLSGCSGCVRDFLALKRAIETAPTTERPSTRAKAKLRSAVIDQLRPKRAAWSSWQRSLAFGMAGATFWAAVFAVHLLASSPGSAPRALVGVTARE